MLQPSRQDSSAMKAGYAGSIWSFDSGYGTGDAAEANSERRATHAIGNGTVWLPTDLFIIEEDADITQFYLQASTSANSLQGRLNASEVDLGSSTLFTNRPLHLQSKTPAGPITGNQNTSTAATQAVADYLPNILKNEDCLSCDLWNLTNPAHDRKCETCQLTAVRTIEPNLVDMYSISGRPHASSLRVFAAATPEAPLGLRPSSKQTRCSACELSSLIDSAGPTSCSSCSPYSPESSQSPGLLSPISHKPKKFKIRRSHAGRSSKLPLAALNCLQAWLDQHRENPYPSVEEKKRLALECGITEKQVATWFTNARARQLSPLDSYLASASEEEIAIESDIASAAQTPPYVSRFTGLSPAPAESPYTGRAGSISGSSAFSSSSRAQHSRRGKKKDYRQKKEQLSQIPQWIPSDQDAAQNQPGNWDQKLWQCTFCLAPLVPKSWRRHEETQHRPRSKWTCMLYGPKISVPSRSSGAPYTICCAFCMAKEPTADHFLHHHRIVDCSKRPLAERTFFRPDHLRQHVRNFHGAGLHEIVQSRWKRGSENQENDEDEGWVCGFCGDTLRDWGVRESHISAHFKDGMRMSMWKTDWGNRPSQEQDRPGSQRSDKRNKKQEKGKEHGFAKLTRRLSRLSTSTRASLSRSNTPKLASPSRSNTLKLGSLSRSNTLNFFSRSPRQSSDLTTEMAAQDLPAPFDTLPPVVLDQGYLCSANAYEPFALAPILPQVNMDPLMEDFEPFPAYQEPDLLPMDWHPGLSVQATPYDNNMHAAQPSFDPGFAYGDGPSYQESSELGTMGGLGDTWNGVGDAHLWQGDWHWNQG